ncbi:HlyD family secretion protein [Desertibaculum subflavum]|uniref:HlyD family secretion protein n=1 Tax=Desertibaculum subflavum TaxID=2268458 RepID=UPI000E67351A
MRNQLKRLGTAGLVLGLASAGGFFGWVWWFAARDLESTDNAYVRGDITAIGPKVGGYVAAVLVGDNQIVGAGTILVRIDDADFRAQLDRARAAVAEAEAATRHLERRQQYQLAIIREADAAVRAARADVELTQRNLARAARLVAQGWTTERNHDVASADSQRAGAALTRVDAAATAARAQLAVIESESAQLAARRQEAAARLRLAEIALDDTVIRAPVAGVIGNKRVQPGQYVEPPAVLMSVVPVQGVWVVANFKETQLARMRVGQAARVAVDGYPDVDIRGVVDSLAPGSGAAFTLLPPDNATGNFTKIVQRVPVKIRLAPDHPLVGRLVPGLSVEVAVDLRSGEGAAPVAQGGRLATLEATFSDGR